VVEFDLPDFPWLFSPYAPDAQDRLQPWICLAAVEKTEGKLTVDASKPLPVLHIDDAKVELPYLSEAWAWAHAQVSGAFDLGKAADAFDKNPERTLSRLICPRRLKPKITYLACVVPTFKGGCQAGLGEKVDDNTALDLAWDANTTAIDLPVLLSLGVQHQRGRRFRIAGVAAPALRGAPVGGRRGFDAGARSRSVRSRAALAYNRATPRSRTAAGRGLATVPRSTDRPAGQSPGHRRLSEVSGKAAGPAQQHNTLTKHPCWLADCTAHLWSLARGAAHHTRVVAACVRSQRGLAA
jgi:hypothetical protein